MSGIPCVHAVAAYMHMKKDPELGVSEWYSQNKWFESYQYSIRPVTGSKFWKPSTFTKPLPLVERKLPGRPRKKRIRHPTENDHEITRQGRIMHCHRCWEAGQNRSNCTKPSRPKPDNFYTEQPSNTDNFAQQQPVQEEMPQFVQDPETTQDQQKKNGK